MISTEKDNIDIFKKTILIEACKVKLKKKLDRNRKSSKRKA